MPPAFAGGSPGGKTGKADSQNPLFLSARKRKGAGTMLTETRQEEILRLLKEKGSVTVTELTEHFGASESTIRRDLNALDKRGALVKVFGGAVQTEETLSTKEEKVSLRAELNREEKVRIARYAASLIGPEDFVYLDAGTTTGYMIPFLTERTAVFVTNAVSHALKLSENGFRVILIGGELKAATEAIVGNEAYANLQKYNFTKGFFGTNGVGEPAGFTTPDINEAMIKQCAMQHTRERYVLCDSSKFHLTSPVSFGGFREAQIITDRMPGGEYESCGNIIVADAAVNNNL